MMKKILFAGVLALAVTSAHSAWSGNASKTKPAGGAYKAVSTLVPLPDHIPGYRLALCRPGDAAGRTVRRL